MHQTEVSIKLAADKNGNSKNLAAYVLDIHEDQFSSSIVWDDIGKEGKVELRADVDAGEGRIVNKVIKLHVGSSISFTITSECYIELLRHHSSGTISIETKESSLDIDLNHTQKKCLKISIDPKTGEVGFNYLVHSPYKQEKALFNYYGYHKPKPDEVKYCVECLGKSNTPSNNHRVKLSNIYPKPGSKPLPLLPFDREDNWTYELNSTLGLNENGNLILSARKPGCVYFYGPSTMLIELLCSREGGLVRLATPDYETVVDTYSSFNDIAYIISSPIDNSFIFYNHTNKIIKNSSLTPVLNVDWEDINQTKFSGAIDGLYAGRISFWIASNENPVQGLPIYLRCNKNCIITTTVDCPRPDIKGKSDKKYAAGAEISIPDYLLQTAISFSAYIKEADHYYLIDELACQPLTESVRSAKSLEKAHHEI